MKNLKKVRQLFDELNGSISYCHWKSNQHFGDALTGTDDLDILIDRNQYEELLLILGKLDFKHFYIPYVRSYAGIEDWLGFDEETGNIFHLHLHSKLTVGEKHLKGFSLPIEKDILENRVWNNEYQVYFSSPYDELLLLILRSAMKNRKRDIIKKTVVGNGALTEFSWLKGNCPDFQEHIEQCEWLSRRLKKDVSFIFANGFNWKQLNATKHHVYKDLSPYSQGSCFYNTIARHWHELGRIWLEVRKRYLKTNYSLLRRRSATGGIIITFIGSDGAGKSTVIKIAKEWLMKVMDVRYFYLGSGDGESSFLRIPLKLTKSVALKFGIIKKANNYSGTDLKKNDSGDKKMRFAQKLWVYTLSRERISKLKTINRCKNRGFVVLTDRYPQDEFDGLCDGRRLRGQSCLAAKKEESAFNLATMIFPDLALKLVISPEVAVQRKPDENDYETSRNLTDRVKSIVFSKNTKSVEINAEMPLEEEMIEIKKHIWKMI